MWFTSPWYNILKAALSCECNSENQLVAYAAPITTTNMWAEEELPEINGGNELNNYSIILLDKKVSRVKKVGSKTICAEEESISKG